MGMWLVLHGFHPSVEQVHFVGRGARRRPSMTDTSRHGCATGSARLATNYDQVLPSGIGDCRGLASAESPAWVASAAEKVRATTAAMSTMRLGSVMCFVISFLPRC